MILSLAIVIVIALLAYERLTTVHHTWVYRNPYDRTCSVCKRNEVEHCHTMDDWGSGSSWWEVFDNGDPQEHAK